MSVLNTLCLISLLLPSLGIASSLSTTQVEKILLRYIDASGGETALLHMKSISRYGLISFYAQGNLNESYCYHTDIIYPNKLREQTS